MVEFGIIWDRLGVFGSVGSVRQCLGEFRRVLERLVDFGSIWESLGEFRRVCKSLGEFMRL